MLILFKAGPPQIKSGLNQEKQPLLLTFTLTFYFLLLIQSVEFNWLNETTKMKMEPWDRPVHPGAVQAPFRDSEETNELGRAL